MNTHPNEVFSFPKHVRNIDYKATNKAAFRMKTLVSETKRKGTNIMNTSTERTITGYKIKDSRTGGIVGKQEGYSTRKQANTIMDRMNQEWGDTRYFIQPLFSN